MTFRGGMGRNGRRLHVGSTDEWEQIELLCGWPEQRDYELIRPLVLFGGPASERAGATGAASERTLQRRVVRFEAEGMESSWGTTGSESGWPTSGRPARSSGGAAVLGRRRGRGVR
jgi:hypothetical protein